MHRYAVSVLRALAKEKELPFNRLMENTGLGADALRWALESLAKDGYIGLRGGARKYAELTDEAKGYAEHGMPEEEIARLASSGALDLTKLTGESERIGVQWAKVKKYIEIHNGIASITAAGAEAIRKESSEQRVLRTLMKEPGKYDALSNTEREVMGELERRKLISVNERKVEPEAAITEKGIDFIKGHVEEVNEINNLDRKSILNREWVGKSFKRYDVKVEVERIYPALRHPLKSTIEEIKDAYVGMGFKEVSGPIVEPAFWVFDFLFEPQDHPARDKQDTFYLSEPASIGVEDKALMKRVKLIHESSWNMEWSEKAASEAVLRTQSTSVSAHKIYEFAKSKEAFPVKLFSIGRVFRNENIDSTHLADFYQTDGIIIGEKLTMANLFDTLIKIYSSLGIKIRFKPSYFPFVEPGVEVEFFYKPKGAWLEMGGAGIIRREIIEATRRKMSVLAWGLGVERILMAKYADLKNMPEIYNNDIGWLRKRRWL